jgi:homoserine/homoserine lactone efflux protein
MSTLIAESTLINFATVALLVTLVPGPAFVTILSTALRRGFRSALYANLGLVTGDAFYFLLTAAGLGSLLTASYWAFTAIKIVGILYLVYLGLRSLVYPDNSLVDAARPTTNGRRAFFTAFSVQLANPKLLLFLAALVPQFIDPARPAPAQFVILGSIFMLSDAVLYSLLAIFAARARTLLSSPRAARLTHRISGAAMLGVAVRIGTER